MSIRMLAPRDYILISIIGLTMLVGIISLIVLAFRVFTDTGSQSRNHNKRNRRRLTLQRLHEPVDTRIGLRRVMY